MINSASYMYMRRASTALTSKVWHTVHSGITRTNRYHVRSYDPQTGTFSTLNAGNAFPDWWLLGSATEYRTIALATGSFGERVIGYPGTFGSKINPGNEESKVFCYDPATNTMLDYTSDATPSRRGR